MKHNEVINEALKSYGKASKELSDHIEKLPLEYKVKFEGIMASIGKAVANRDANALMRLQQEVNKIIQENGNSNIPK